MSAAEAVIGASDHYARAELVTLAVVDASPAFLDRRRVKLIDQGLPIAPYHHEALELACLSHHPTAEARDTTAMTSLRLLDVLDVPSSTPARAKRLAPFSSARLAPSPDGPLTHFASPRGEKGRPDIDAAIDLVNRVRRSATEHASAAISTLLATYRAQVLILPSSPYDSLPDSLEKVLSSHRLTLAADGMLYREALAKAAAELGMEVRRYPRKTDPTVLAAEAMGVDAAEVTSLIAQFGREAGTPWRKDHKMAAAAALSVIGHQIRKGRDSCLVSREKP